MQSLSAIINLYKESVKNVPILKYSWVLITCICISVIAGYFKLKNVDIFIDAIGILLVSFLAFILSSLTKNSTAFIRGLVNVFSTIVVSALSLLVIGFCIFVFSGKPVFFNRWFPDKNISKSDASNKSLSLKKEYGPTTLPVEQNPKKNDTPKDKPVQILSIQLKDETDGYSKIFINGKQVPVLAESTRLNPRIQLDNNFLSQNLLIITNRGDSCISLLPSQISSSIIRFIPNCD